MLLYVYYYTIFCHLFSIWFVCVLIWRRHPLVFWYWLLCISQPSRAKVTQLCVNSLSVQLEMAALLRGVRAGRALRGLASGKTGRLSCFHLMLTTARLENHSCSCNSFGFFCCKSANEPMLTLALPAKVICQRWSWRTELANIYVGCGFIS